MTDAIFDPIFDTKAAGADPVDMDDSDAADEACSPSTGNMGSTGANAQTTHPPRVVIMVRDGDNNTFPVGPFNSVNDAYDYIKMRRMCEDYWISIIDIAPAF